MLRHTQSLSFIANVVPSGKSQRKKPTCTMSDSPSRSCASADWSVAAIAEHAAKESLHAGSYFVKRRPRPPYFEGWYLRVVLPNSTRSFAFMFSIEAEGPGTLQVLDPEDCLHKLALPPEKRGRFFADAQTLSVGHWGYTKSSSGQPRTLAGEDFESLVLQGYQLTKTSCHGRFLGEHGQVQWGLQYDPVLSCGERGKRPRSTATWLGYLPMLDPGYQILMAHGVVSGGYISIDGKQEDVAGAVVYAEKNWGSAFPRRWWWLQANAFDHVPDLSITALGAIRRVLWFEEAVGLVAIHYKGLFYEFANWSFDSMRWNVKPWGVWKVSSTAKTGHKVDISACTDESPVGVLGPSSAGMIFNVLDNARGQLSITLRDPSGEPILEEVTCFSAQVEVGGGPWPEPWVVSARPMPQPLRGLVNLFNHPAVQTSRR